jgi:hypothetical protein
MTGISRRDREGRSRALNAVSTDEGQSASNGPDAAKPFGCFQGDLDGDAVGIVQVDGLGERVVGRRARIAKVREPLQQPSKIPLVRNMYRHMVEAAVATSDRYGRAAMQDDQRLLLGAQLDAVTRGAAGEPEEAFPEARRRVDIPDLQVNRAEGDQITPGHAGHSGR